MITFLILNCFRFNSIFVAKCLDHNLYSYNVRVCKTIGKYSYTTYVKNIMILFLVLDSVPGSIYKRLYVNRVHVSHRINVL